jgi:hypothetical protein
LPLIAFLAYTAVSMLMVNRPGHPFLPGWVGGKVQPSDLLFPLAMVPWLIAGFPGLGRVAGAIGVPVGIWVAANVVTATVAVSPFPAWRESAAFAYLGLVVLWGASLLTEPHYLDRFVRGWLLIVAAVVVVGLAGWLTATVSGASNPFVETARQMPLFGDWVFRIESTLEPTAKLLSTLLILALPPVFALRRWGRSRERIRAGWLIGAMTVCEALTFSRQLLEFTGLLAVLTVLERPRGRRVLLVAVGIAYLAGFLLIQGLSTWRITDVEVTHAADRGRFVADRNYYTTLPDIGVRTLAARLEYVHDNYFVLKRTGWKGFLERPIAGWGPDTFPKVLEWSKAAGFVPGAFPRFDSAQSEMFTIAAEMGLLGLAAWAAFWMLSLRSMWVSTAQGFAGTLARYQALGCGATLLTSINLDVMRFRFLWIALALGIASAVCARQEAPA